MQPSPARTTPTIGAGLKEKPVGGGRARRGKARTIDEEMATKKRIQNGSEEMTAEIRRLKGGGC